MADNVPKDIQLAFDWDRLFRSQILWETVALENTLDKIIAWHFCPDESRHELLFQYGGVGLAAKIRILEDLLRNSYPELKGAFDFLPNRLNALRGIRNKFAHGELVLPADGAQPKIEDGVTLRYWKKGKRVDEFISEAQITSLVSECELLVLAALSLERIVSGRVQGSLEADEEASLVKAVSSLQRK